MDSVMPGKIETDRQPIQDSWMMIGASAAGFEPCNDRYICVRLALTT